MKDRDLFILYSTIAVDDLVMQGARALKAKLLTEFDCNIPCQHQKG